MGRFATDSSSIGGGCDGGKLDAVRCRRNTQDNVTLITDHGNYMNAFRDALLDGASLCNGRICLSAGAKVFDQPAGLGDRAGREPGPRIDIAVRGEVAIADKLPGASS